jgi:hypothetical protein
MEESDSTKLPLLLHQAINAVLDQIEQILTKPRGELVELNRALASLQLRRKELNHRDQGGAKGTNRPKAA